MPDEQIAESSTATETAAAEAPQAPPPIETWSSEQRTEWLKSGNPPQAADPAPARETSGAKPDAGEPKPAPTSEPDKQQEPPRKKGGEDRKAELAKEIQDLLRLRAELRQELSPPAERQHAESAPAREQQPTGKPVPPDPNTWKGTYDELEAARLEYLDKLQDWKLEQRDLARQQAEQQRKAAEAQQAANESWQQRMTALKSKPEYADFDEVLGSADIPITPAIREAIMTDDHGPELAYHLAQHPDEAKRIAQLPPHLAGRELGKVVASLAHPKTPEPKKVTSASAPPRELAAKATQPEDEAEAALKAGDFTRYRRVMNSRALKG